MKTIYKMAIFDMDGTLINGSLIKTMGTKLGIYDKIYSIQSNASIPGYFKTFKIARLLKGFGIEEIETALESIPLAKNCLKIISLLKKNGLKIGIITDSYNIAGKILKRRFNLDFYLANNLQILNRIITGNIVMPLGWQIINCFCKNSVCKRYHLEMFALKYNISPEEVIAVGDTKGDACMVKRAGLGIAFMPKDEIINKSKNIIKNPDLMEIENYIE